jgi:hypothetical protein
MSIRQITIFECEECGHKSYTDEEVSLFDDPVVTPPEKFWRYCGWPMKERLMCPTCAEKYYERHKS